MQTSTSESFPPVLTCPPDGGVQCSGPTHPYIQHCCVMSLPAHSELIQHEDFLTTQTKIKNKMNKCSLILIREDYCVVLPHWRRLVIFTLNTKLIGMRHFNEDTRNTGM